MLTVFLLVGQAVTALQLTFALLLRKARAGRKLIRNQALNVLHHHHRQALVAVAVQEEAAAVAAADRADHNL